MGRRDTGTSLADRLVAGAVVSAMDPATAPEAGVTALVRISGGNRLALRRAIQRVERSHWARPSRIAAAAIETLRRALAVLDAREALGAGARDRRLARQADGPVSPRSGPASA